MLTPKVSIGTATAAGKPHAVVIGSGFGGLAAAIRLGARGYRVTVFEKLDAPGGRAYVHRQDGFTFDAGPTVITGWGSTGWVTGSTCSMGKTGSGPSSSTGCSPQPLTTTIIRIGNRMFVSLSGGTQECATWTKVYQRHLHRDNRWPPSLA